VADGLGASLDCFMPRKPKLFLAEVDDGARAAGVAAEIDPPPGLLGDDYLLPSPCSPHLDGSPHATGAVDHPAILPGKVGKVDLGFCFVEVHG
jgi:hypothetical protein